MWSLDVDGKVAVYQSSRSSVGRTRPSRAGYLHSIKRSLTFVGSHLALTQSNERTVKPGTRPRGTEAHQMYAATFESPYYDEELL